MGENFAMVGYASGGTIWWRQMVSSERQANWNPWWRSSSRKKIENRAAASRSGQCIAGGPTTGSDYAKYNYDTKPERSIQPVPGFDDEAARLDCSARPANVFDPTWL